MKSIVFYLTSSTNTFLLFIQRFWMMKAQLDAIAIKWHLFSSFYTVKISGPICVSRVAFLSSRYYKPLLLFSLWLVNNMIYMNSWKSWELHKTLDGCRETNEGSSVSGQAQEFSDCKFVQPSCVTTEMRMFVCKERKQVNYKSWLWISLFPTITVRFWPFWLKSVCQPKWKQINRLMANDLISGTLLEFIVYFNALYLI